MKEISIENFKENPFTMIGKDWLLITAEKDNKTNMMTASWGGLGVMWGKNVASVYIRPSRYTKEFIDQGEKFSICVLPENFREAYNLCGSKSGRQIDKVKESGLKVEKSDDCPYFSESKLVLICKKIYSQPMYAENLMDEAARDRFWKDDVHELYMAEIEKILIK